MSETEAVDRAWEQVVEAETAYFRAVAEIPRSELGVILSAALGELTGRRTALRLLESSTPDLVSEVLPALWPWLETAHPLLPLARRVLAVPTSPMSPSPSGEPKREPRVVVRQIGGPQPTERGCQNP